MAWLVHRRAETLAVYTRLSEKKLLLRGGQREPIVQDETPVDELFRSAFAGLQVKIK
ncbi:MAG: hypothetical protein GTO40_26345 [Deltaproteobacteria bacterium]|nr:hypothetical protein [Deltaproteobacteria bacterium]